LADLSPTVEIYVSNLNAHVLAVAANYEDQDGSLEKPFVNFEDAITRLDELVG